jgi:hypothetical protein
MNPAKYCSTVVLIAVIRTTGASNQESELGSATFGNEKLSLSYPKKYYEAAKIDTLPKKIYEGKGSPFRVGPSRYAIELIPYHQQPRDGGRYDYPSYSVVYVTPLHDQTVADFDKAYPGLSDSGRLLQELLKERPTDLFAWLVRQSRPSGRWVLPDEPFNNAGALLLAKFRTISTSWGTGCRFLTYYRNGKAGYGATNEELLYNFQGITKNSAFYISARVAVRHDRLPDSIDDPRAASEETEEEQRAEHDRTDVWPDKSFFPPLARLDCIIESLEITR